MQVRPARDAESTAEWIVDITTLADRQGRAMQFADGYNQSQLRQQNEQQLQKCLLNGHGQVPLSRIRLWSPNLKDLAYPSFCALVATLCLSVDW